MIKSGEEGMAPLGNGTEAQEVGMVAFTRSVSRIMTRNNYIGGPQRVLHPRLLVATSLNGTGRCRKVELRAAEHSCFSPSHWKQ